MSTISTSTLHQLCHAPSLWTNCINQIGALWQPNDALLLLGSAAQGVHDPRLNAFKIVYVLQADLDILGITTDQIQCKILSYDQWAQLVLSHQRHVTWK
ncbi:MAG: hypothetical protein EOO69_06210 [Moraxellaceae bacterium]|nr:MAG: hypothetical protein EOO69_06210 [Moraxellaceae bacterium]